MSDHYDPPSRGAHRGERNLEQWRVLLVAGLVILLLGLLIPDPLGGAGMLIGIGCLVAGGTWRILKGP